MYNTLLFGVILIMLGLSLLIKTIFGLDLPIFRLLIAGFLLYFGFMTLVGGKPFDQKWIFFSEKILTPTQPIRQYNIVFGKGIIDLSQISPTIDEHTVKINTIFGETIIKTNAQIPTTIQAHVTFGETTLPDTRHLSLGSDTYSSLSNNEKVRLRIESNTIFGSTKIQAE